MHTEDHVVWINFDVLERFMADVLAGVGVPRDDAELVAKVLILSDKRGIDSHGIGRLKPIYVDRIRDGQINPVTKLELVKEGPTTAVYDANNGMGQVAGHHAMMKAIEKAKQFGLGMTAVRNSNHYGIAGYYVMLAIEHGMIGITGTNARPSIAPTFGVENMLGTNPLTFGIPTDEDFPFVLDCATSISQRGKIEVYARKKKPLPEGWVIGENGEPLTDAEQVLKDLVSGKASLVPLGGIGEDMGGYKGYGYATVVEILSAALQGGAFLKGLLGFDEKGNKVPYRLGHFFIAINIEAFTELSAFKKTAGDILRQLRASKKMPQASRIYTAGEKEYEAWLERKDKGCPVDIELQKQILTLQKELNLTHYKFPF